MSNTKDTKVITLKLGSDVEIAKCIAAELAEEFGEVPFSEGQFWRFNSTHWVPIPSFELRRRVHAYDGARYEKQRIRLGEKRIDSILHELGAVLSTPKFFENAPTGINCHSGFIVFGEDGDPRLYPHMPAQRQRHKLPGSWKPGGKGRPPQNSLLAKLLNGCFDGDHHAVEKMELMAEVAGAAALGYATRLSAPQAVVLLGRTAGNGKSQILDLLRGLLPESAVSSIPPSKFNDEHHAVKLVGKLLNASDELGTARAIASDAFKSIVTGEPMTARDVYNSSMEFRPAAQQVFACNQLPTFASGMDQGVMRRLLVIPFDRTIPKPERVPHIGRSVVEKEPDLLLAWAVAGAERLLSRGHYPELDFAQDALAEWAQTSDAVLGWIDARVVTGLAVVGKPAPRVSSAEAYNNFTDWAKDEGLRADRIPAKNTFVQRVEAALADRGVKRKHSGHFRGFEGMRLRPVTTPEDLSKPFHAMSA